MAAAKQKVGGDTLREGHTEAQKRERAGRTQGKGGLKLGSPEWVAMMAEKKRAKIEAGHVEAKGGPAKKPTMTEARNAALERLVPRAIKVLEKQLSSEDEKVAANAAVKLLEHGRGKPAQTIHQTGEQVTKIVYETAALGHGN